MKIIELIVDSKILDDLFIQFVILAVLSISVAFVMDILLNGWNQELN